jgi:translation initiation factor IF-1
MSTQDPTVNKVTGVVTEALPNTEFKVQLEGQQVIHAYLRGKMKLNRIRVLVGDRVEVELNPYDGKSRIVRRL